MPKIKYTFSDGTKQEIEVSDEVAAAYAQLEDYEQKTNRKETRRHSSIESLQEAGMDFFDDKNSIENIIEQKENIKIQNKREHDDELWLENKKKSLLLKLTPRQAEAYFQYRYMYLKKVNIAKNMSVTEGAVRKLILKAQANLAKLKAERNKLK